MILPYLSALILCFSMISSLPAYAESPSEQGEAPLFSNKDLEKYRTPSPATSAPSAPEAKYRDEKFRKTERAREAADQEYWCKKASPLRKRIDRGREDLFKKERALAALKASAGEATRKKTAEAEKAVESSSRKLREAEEDLADIEDEAHRKGVPPGWLRCQFSE